MKLLMKTKNKRVYIHSMSILGEKIFNFTTMPFHKMRGNVYENRLWMTNYRGKISEWFPEGYFNKVLKDYEGREILIRIEISDIGEINET